MTFLIAFAGPSRSGKGSCAKIFTDLAHDLGLTVLERQFSDNGKWSLARIFRPTIGRFEAVAWFEQMKIREYAQVKIEWDAQPAPHSMTVTLQEFLQHGMQEGGRDIFGADLWTDMILAPPTSAESMFADDRISPSWHETFFDGEVAVAPTDLAIISDLRQPNEAERVRRLDGVVIECIRPTVADKYRTGAGHITELRLARELVDYQIINDRGPRELEDMARLAFQEVVVPVLEGTP